MWNKKNETKNKQWNKTVCMYMGGQWESPLEEIMEILLWNHSNVIFLPTDLSFNNIAKIHYIICVDQCMATSQINQIEHESDLIKT